MTPHAIQPHSMPCLVVILGLFCITISGCLSGTESFDDADVQAVDDTKPDVGKELPATLVALTIVNPFQTLHVGEFRQLLVRGVDEDGNLHPLSSVTWQNQAPEIISVLDGKIVGLTPGNARVIAVANGLEISLDISVTDFRPAALTLSSQQVMLDWESSVLVTAVVSAPSGQVTEARPMWQSAADEIATVDQTGKISGKRAGKTQITVRYETLSASIDVLVVEPQLHSLVITPQLVQMNVGSSEALQIKPLTAHGNPHSTSDFEWTVYDTNVATVDAHGVVTAVNNGTTELTAQSGDVSAVVLIQVDPQFDRTVFPGPCSLLFTEHLFNEVDAQWRKFWTYDDNGRVLSELQLDKKYGRDDLLNYRIETSYDDTDQRVDKLFGSDDKLKSITTKTYDARGLLLSKTTTSDGELISAATWTYDPRGLLITEKKEMPGYQPTEWLNTYNEDAKLVSRKKVSSNVPYEGIFEYNAQGQLRFETYRLNHDIQKKLTYEYENGRLSYYVEEHNIPSYDSTVYWQIESYYYNDRDQIIARNHYGYEYGYNGRATKFDNVIFNELDFAGNLHRQEVWNILPIEPALTQRRQYSYDCWLN